MPTPRGPATVDDVEPRVPHVVVHRVEAHADRLLLEQHRPRREHPVVEVGGPRSPVAFVRRDLGHRPADVDGRVPVGDVAVELQPHPRTAPPRDLVAVAAEVEHLLHRRRQPSAGIARSASVHSVDDGTVDDLHSGSSPTAASTPPVGGHAGEVGVPQRVTRAVEAGRLRVPEPDHAVDGARWAPAAPVACPRARSPRGPRSRR